MSGNAGVPESEHGDADRHEMLDMNDYKYVPPHAKRSFDNLYMISYEFHDIIYDVIIFFVIPMS